MGSGEPGGSGSPSPQPQALRFSGKELGSAQEAMEAVDRGSGTEVSDVTKSCQPWGQGHCSRRNHGRAGEDSSSTHGVRAEMMLKFMLSY